ncbi:restriction endonuclease subunit S [Sphingobacterium sp. lm-10]|uniref:restriction endonuclease subunit S n=1 Tax=Sphingobacterium sp. lm-10 TaxID=2944904 RepID=UPI002020C5F5|nr:restriction endonuclease subunit S [Sphingobacterium sp. lm-10]MCL7987063.1 restriction endonuclease subunit S [Sphingobacterium sp. lm-10]
MVKENKMVQTEIGLVSEDWVLETFGDCMEGFSSGMTPYRGNKEYYIGDFPWITSGELNYNIIKDTIEKISLLAIKNTNLKIIPKGTFLMAITGLEAEGTRGSCAITGIKATTNQSCMALYPQKNKINTSFLYHYYVAFGNELALKYCQGTKQQSYNALTAKKLPICYPKSLPEQEAIAEALSDADSWIESLEQLIAKKRLIKQGTMQELLSPKEDWEEKKLGEMSIIYTGRKNNQDKIENGVYPFFVRSQTIERINSYSFDGEAILIPGEGNLGSIVHYINGKFDFHQRVYKISDFVNSNGKYLYWYFRMYFGNHAMQNTVKATVDSIRLPTLQEFKIQFPSLTEQSRIATILSDMDAELEALEAQLGKARKVKQGMMQELLTGRVRLV